MRSGVQGSTQGHYPGSIPLQAWPAGTYPFSDVVGDCALILRGDNLVLDLAHSMDNIYAREHAPRPHHLGTVPDDTSALASWATVVTSGRLPPGGLQFACWTRSAPAMHVAHDRCPRGTA